MAVLKCSLLFVLCNLFSVLSLVFGNVPVLLWESNKSNKENAFRALSRVSSDKFSQYLLKKVQGQEPLPLVVLFSEASLSCEDFSGQDSQRHGYFPKLQNITGSAAGVEFLTSVESPIEAVKKLDKYGYKIQYLEDSNLPTKDGVLLIVKLQDANADEDRPELLRRHDDKITSIYSELLAHYSHVIAVFTGMQSSWVEPEEVTRFKREVRATNSSEIHWKGSSSEQQILLYSSTIPEYFDGTNDIDLSQYNQSVVTTSKSGDNLFLSVKLYNNSISVNFKFTFTSAGGYWTLNDVAVYTATGSTTSSTVVVVPLSDVYAPLNMSYHSSLPVVFYSSNYTVKAKLTFSDIQVEPFFDAVPSVDAFNDAVDNITFFTIPIWSGIFTITILSMIFIWGMTMIMDIRTMDQFDDPKGKTITVTTTE